MVRLGRVLRVLRGHQGTGRLILMAEARKWKTTDGTVFTASDEVAARVRGAKPFEAEEKPKATPRKRTTSK